MNRLFSKIEVKAADSDTWTFSGIASTPATDRMRDTVDPHGASIELPLPLLWQHDPDKPIGHVTTAKVTDDGIAITARVQKPDSDMPRGLVGRLEEAWYSIKNGLVRGLSIGFMPLKFEPNDDGGMHISHYDLMEVSAVTVPANQEATIQTIKSLSAPTEPITRPHGGYSLRTTFKHLRKD